MSNIGMMDGAFFVGRKEIIDWINLTLNLNLSKVEQTASGAIACQLLDVMYPEQVPMHKVNWSAKQEFEFIQNYKILQTCFTKLNIDRHVDVDRLIKGRYQDNLEFMQWFKRFFEMGTNPDNGEYDALGRRSRGKGGAQYAYNSSGSSRGGEAGAASSSAGTSTNTNTTTTKSKGHIAAPPSRVKNIQRTGSSSAPSAESRQTGQKSTSQAVQAAAQASQASQVSQAPPVPAPSVGGASDDKSALTQALQTVSHLQGEIERLQTVNDELQTEMNGIEKERDFYFDKLRDIELMLQDLEDSGASHLGADLTAKIFEILYATAEGFQPADGGAVGKNDNAMESGHEVEEDETY